MTNERLNSLWVGNQIGLIERLSIVSAMKLGHPITIYSYTPDELTGVPEGAEIRDAREVMPEDRLLRYSDTGAVALGSNFFRYELMAQSKGYWVDLDLLFLRPLNFTNEYVVGWEYEGWLNGAVLKAPAGSPFVNDLMTLPQNNRCPQWFGPRRALQYYWRRLKEGSIRIEDMPWGTYSAQMITYIAKKRGVISEALTPDVFYPIRWADADQLFGPAELVEAQITGKTRAVHLWNSRHVERLKSPIPCGSFIDTACRTLGIDGYATA